MARTGLPFSQVIEQERRRWLPFRQALSPEDQQVFDRLFACVRRQVEGTVSIFRPRVFEILVLAVLLEQHKQMERAQRLLNELQERVQV